MLAMACIVHAENSVQWKGCLHPRSTSMTERGTEPLWPVAQSSVRGSPRAASGPGQLLASAMTLQRRTVLGWVLILGIVSPALLAAFVNHHDDATPLEDPATQLHASDNVSLV